MEGLGGLKRAVFMLGALEACAVDVHGSGTMDSFHDSEQGQVDHDGDPWSVQDGLGAGGKDRAKDASAAGSATDDVSDPGSLADAQLGPGSRDDAGDVAPTVPDSADGGTHSGPGSTPRIVDGASSQGEWDDAIWSRQTVASDWGDERNALHALAVAMDDEFLWLRVEGAVELANAIVVYVDSVANAGMAPSALNDRVGTIDDAISCGVTTPTARAPDFAWATRAMDDGGAWVGAPGWRELRDASNLSEVDENVAKTACTQGLCETRIARSAIRAQDDVYVFARLVNGTGDLRSNQALPVQADGHTEHATDLMLVSAP